MKKIASLLTLTLFFFLASFSQITIYSATYDGGVLPANWSIDNFGSTGNYEVIYTDSSAADDYVLCQTDAHSEDLDQYFILSDTISTTEYTTITIGWDGKKSANPTSWDVLTTMNVEYSTDGVSWTAIQAFTDVTAGGNWQTVAPVNVDAGAEAEDQANLRFRYRYVSNASNTAHYRINNFLIQGVCKTPINDATGVTVTDNYSASATLNWTLSTDASNSLVVMTSDAHASITVSPVSTTTYTANAVYGSGQDIDATGEAEYVMYNGTGGSVNLSGLSPNTTYYYEIYSFNDCDSNPEYKTTGITGSFTTSSRWNSISGADLSTAAGWESDDDDNASTNVYTGTFNDANTDFYINDAGATMTNAALNISGSGSRLVLETGADFTTNSSGAKPLTANVTLEGAGEITLRNSANPTLDSLSSTSTVIYDGNGTSIASTTYANLTSSASSTLAGNVTVNSTLKLNDPMSIGTNTLTLVGTVTGASTISGTSSSNLTIEGTGALGTLSFTSTPSNRLGTFTINRTGASNDVLLGTDVEVFTTLVLTEAIFDLNGSSITLDGATVTNTSGSIKGNATSRFICNGTGAIGTMPIDQTSSSTRSFQRIVNARTGGVTLILGNDAIITQQLLITDASGIIDLNGTTLEMSDANFTGAGTVNGNSGILLITGTTTSPGTILMDQTSDATKTLATVTMNHSGAGSKLTFGSDVIISSALNITDGTVSNGGFTIDGTSATLTVTAGDTLDLAGTTSFPTFGTEIMDRLGVTLYSGGAQSVTAKTYGSLAFTGAATKTLAGTGGVLNGEMSIKRLRPSM
ncbi:MAG: fibronectin type III domain-containing protein [Flavobacteriales bacterium]|nr:fibronectin type III domain-containing protein [Flavobacteriales bacterium]